MARQPRNYKSGGVEGGGFAWSTKVDQQRRHDEAPERNVAAYFSCVHFILHP